MDTFSIIIFFIVFAALSHTIFDYASKAEHREGDGKYIILGSVVFLFYMFYTMVV